MGRKIITIAGTRPELIRLSVIISKLDKRCDHTLLWTGQNYTESLGAVFFECLGIREPDVRRPDEPFSSLADQLTSSFTMVERSVLENEPDAALVLGDTNSALAAAIICERLNIPVYHMEAGNRCFDDRVPEEKNRRMIDAICSHSLPYTPGSCQNLINEGHSHAQIFVCGNPIYEVIKTYSSHISDSEILSKLQIRKGAYFLSTFHRQENVDHAGRLGQILEGLQQASERMNTPVICSMHPRTHGKIKEFDLSVGSNIRICEPFNFFDFIKLEQHAAGVFTDSGTVQEECCLFHVPTVTMRDSTERPETVACGSNLVSGLQSNQIVECMVEMFARSKAWHIPDGYQYPAVADRVLEYMGV